MPPLPTSLCKDICHLRALYISSTSLEMCQEKYWLHLSAHFTFISSVRTCVSVIFHSTELFQTILWGDICSIICHSHILQFLIWYSLVHLHSCAKKGFNSWPFGGLSNIPSILERLDAPGWTMNMVPGGRVVFEHIPHISLGEDKEVGVAHRSHRGCSTIAWPSSSASPSPPWWWHHRHHPHLQCPCWGLRSRQSRIRLSTLPTRFSHPCQPPDDHCCAGDGDGDDDDDDDEGSDDDDDDDNDDDGDDDHNLEPTPGADVHLFPNFPWRQSLLLFVVHQHSHFLRPLSLFTTTLIFITTLAFTCF